MHLFGMTGIIVKRVNYLRFGPEGQLLQDNCPKHLLVTTLTSWAEVWGIEVNWSEREIGRLLRCIMTGIYNAIHRLPLTLVAIRPPFLFLGLQLITLQSIKWGKILHVFRYHAHPKEEMFESKHICIVLRRIKCALSLYTYISSLLMLHYKFKEINMTYLMNLS